MTQVIGAAFVLMLFCCVLLMVFRAIEFINDIINERRRKSAKRQRAKRNTLYLHRVDGCFKMFRSYQRELATEVKGTGVIICPHCSNGAISAKLVKKEDSWMASHPDCSKISMLDYVKIKMSIRAYKKARDEQAEIERFEEYNSIKVDKYWVDNLQEQMEKFRQ